MSDKSISDWFEGFSGRAQELAVACILEERDYQDQKHGSLYEGGGHTLGEWALILEFELLEFKQALIKGGEGRDSPRSELVQIAAVALAALQQHGTIDPHKGRQI